MFGFIALAAAYTAASLVGVWQSTASFGPKLSGRIALSETAIGWRATVACRCHAERSSPRLVSANAVEGRPNELRFDDGSHLELRRVEGRLIGQWTQPPTVTTQEAFATPIVFTRTTATTWTGTIHPIADVAHFFLAVWRDGTSVQAILRNPELNIGGTARVVTDGASVRLEHGRHVTSGWIDATGRHLTLYLPGTLGNTPGRLVFTRVAENAALGYVARRGNAPYAYRVPVENGDGWRTAPLRSVGLNPEPLVAYIDSLLNERPRSYHAPYVQSLLIARHGKLVLDEYFFGYDRNRPHDVRSAGKSVTTLMVGRAMQSGAAFSPQSRVYPMFSREGPFTNPDPRKARVTVADLMTMSPGWACDDNDDHSPGSEDAMQSQTRQPDWYKFALDLPMAYEPGTKSVYCTAAVNLLGGVISSASRRSLVNAFYDWFARPLQFGTYGMFITPPPPSVAYMGGGDHFLPRDFLKFGQLFLNRGRWNGRLVIDPRWLSQVAARRTQITGQEGGYGYGWHLYTYHVHGREIYAINAGGNGGQLLYVFPQLDMTVMITAGNYGDYYRGWRPLVKRVIPDVILASALR